MDFKEGLLLTVLYKLAAGIMRLIFGIVLLCFGDLHRLLFFLFGRELLEDPHDFLFNLATLHIKDVSSGMVILFSYFLIIYSIFEIFFSIGLYFRKRWAVIGLVLILGVGILFDLFFVSKILILSKFVGVFVDLVIVFFLLDLLIKHRSLFKK